MATAREQDAESWGTARTSQRVAKYTDRVWCRLNTFLVAAFIALLIVWPEGYAVIPLLGTGIAMIGSLAAVRRADRLDKEDALWLLTLLGFSGVWLADVARTGVWPQAQGNYGILLPFWPLLAAGLLLWLRCFPPAKLGWWWGLVCGASGAGVIAVYERAWLGVSRADNGMNAIPFGNLALLLGVLALVAMLGRVGRPSRYANWLTVLLGLAALGGMSASLLSGTRGGWIAFPLLGWLIYRTFHTVLAGRCLAIVTGILVALLLGMLLLPQSGVQSRAMLAVENIQRYFSEEEKGTSIGLRLEMWRAGKLLFFKKPLAGWGEGQLESARDAIVDAGKLHPGISRYDQLHSEIIDTAARRGLVGLAALIALYSVPFLLFSRHLRGERDPRLRALALSGLLVPVAYVDFGLTQSMLRDVHGLLGYLGLSIVCWSLLKTGRRVPPCQVDASR